MMSDDFRAGILELLSEGKITTTEAIEMLDRGPDAGPAQAGIRAWDQPCRARADRAALGKQLGLSRVQLSLQRLSTASTFRRGLGPKARWA